MKKIMYIAAALIAAASFAACNKDDDNNDDNSCLAGTGGGLAVVGFPKHHTKSIFSQDTYLDTVLVKFNTQDSPGENISDYDTLFVGEPGEDHVHMTGLKCGNYYFFATGYDTSIHQRVKGGIPFHTTQNSGELDLDLPVTEGD